ncbi:MAG: flagellar hook-length control protein FliK [Spirochaetales bacterium]|nr:flagellar hook-length control protein FliK [Spirochaetales bacterium]
MFVHVTGTRQCIPEQQSGASQVRQEKTGKPADSLFAVLLGKSISTAQGKLAEKLKKAADSAKSGAKTGKTAGKDGQPDLQAGKAGTKENKTAKAGELKHVKTSGAAELRKTKKQETENELKQKKPLQDRGGILTEGNSIPLRSVIAVKSAETDKRVRKAGKPPITVAMSGESTQLKTVFARQQKTGAAESLAEKRSEGEGKIRHLVVDLRNKNKPVSSTASSGQSGAHNGGSADLDAGVSSRQSTLQGMTDLKTSEQFEKLSQAKQTDILHTQLRDGLNAEIVKQTRFIIDSDSKGEIRLVLKPEHLGNVRIRINLEDNHIAGKILVENNTVKEAFQQNMRHLQDAFRENGFESAAMDVFVEDRNSGRNQDGKQGRQHNAVMVENTVSARTALFEILGTDSLIDLTA